MEAAERDDTTYVREARVLLASAKKLPLGQTSSLASSSTEALGLQKAQEHHYNTRNVMEKTKERVIEKSSRWEIFLYSLPPAPENLAKCPIPYLGKYTR